MDPDDPWLDSRSPEDFILARKPVAELSNHVIEQLVRDSESAIRKKDVSGLMSMLGLDFVYTDLELINGKFEVIEGNRDRYLIGLCCLFESSDCSEYSMTMDSIEMISSLCAVAYLCVKNPAIAWFQNCYANEAKEKVFIALHKQRPIITKLEIMDLQQ
jgi:hypothetical protein